MNINAERLAATFVALCEIDSPSRREGKVCAQLKRIFASLQPEEIVEDDSGASTGSDCGNLVVRFSGTTAGVPIFFNCHMDTVEPAAGVKVQREGDTFRSAGDTVLGGDDKAGIAVLVEAMRHVRENRLGHGPVEFVFTTCEEIGLLGAKNLACETIRARMGFALDTTGTDTVVVGAPAANRFVAEIIGLAAHAGLNPDGGISAVQLAAGAIASLRLGRLDQESTANIGVISGGKATNIVPDYTRVEGEVRSHFPERLSFHTQKIEETFRAATAGWNGPRGALAARPKLVFTAEEQFPAMSPGPDDPVLLRLAAASRALGREVRSLVAGGGSDANIFNGRGLRTAILGTGMTDVHTTEESITLAAMVRTAELVVSLVTI